MTVPIVQCGSDGIIPKNPVVASWGCIFLLHPITDNDPANGGKKGTTKTGTDACMDDPDGSSATKVCVEYRGAANDGSSPCGSSGVPGAPTSPGALVPALVK